MYNVKLIDFSISGIVHPLINVFIKMPNSFSLKLIVDDSEIPLIDLEIIGTDFVNKLIKDGVYRYNYKANILKKSKKAFLYVIDDNGKEILLSELKVNTSIRVLRSLICKMKGIAKKIVKIPKVIFKTIKLMWNRHHFLIPPKLLKQYFKAFFDNIVAVPESFANPLNQNDYLKWLEKNDVNSKITKLKYNPLISIIIPVYNVSYKILSECIDSVLNQTYENFEICLADDCSSNEETIKCLKYYESKDPRVKVVYREKNGHISAASNSALKIASGEFIGLLDNDDLLHKDALYEVVNVLNSDKQIDMIYTDEDKIALNGKRYFPHFKPDFSPDTLLSSNYICHFTVLRKKIVEEIGGLRGEYNGSQDYDLFLRFTERTKKIYHIPKVLYHWRMIEGSTSSDASSKNYAYEAGKRALEDALKRRKINAKVNMLGTPQMYDIEYLLDEKPLISIIIPTKDKSDILKRCVDSIYDKTNYDNFEIIVINNNSVEDTTFALLDDYKNKYDNFSYYTYNCEFNYSYLNNQGVKHSKGEYVVLLNNDTEIVSANWLSKMVGYASQNHIGCVGAKLLYPTNTVQHCGVVIGCAGIAAHAFIGFDRNDYGFFGRLVAVYNWSAVTAACLMVKKDKYLQVKGLDEKLKVAYNDVDFNIKMLQEGYYNVVLPDVVLYHYESLSRGNDLDDKHKQRFISEIKYMCNKWHQMKFHDNFYNDNLSKYNPFYFDKK